MYKIKKKLKSKCRNTCVDNTHTQGMVAGWEGVLVKENDE